MRAVIQLVSSASVVVNNETISKISRGLVVLVGIGTDDTTTDASTLIKKMFVYFDSVSVVPRFNRFSPELAPVVPIKVFDDPNDSQKKWKASVKDIDGDVLCVSQFTLMAGTTKNKPDFHRAMSANASREMYSSFLEKMRQSYKPDKIHDGQFGAMMSVGLINEGPVTFTIDSRKYAYLDEATEGNKSVIPNATDTDGPKDVI